MGNDVYEENKRLKAENERLLSNMRNQERKFEETSTKGLEAFAKFAIALMEGRVHLIQGGNGWNWFVKVEGE